MRMQIARRCLILALMFMTSLALACGGGSGRFPSSPSSTQASKLIGPDGGVITVTDTASPIFGTSLVIPAGALSTSVMISISYETTPRTFSGYIQKQGVEVILLPSGLKFKDFVYLTMPFSGITNNDGVIGQLRDTPGGKASFLSPIEVNLSGVPKVTFPLRHFTSLLPVGTTVGPTLLPGFGTDTGFEPGDDGWHQPNDDRFGSGGDCFAMSLFAIWYNANKGPNDPDLSDLLAGNPLREAKLRFLAFAMQQEITKYWKNMMTNERWQGILAMTPNQRAANILFMLWITGEPQTLVLWKHPGTQHAVVVKGYDAVNKRFIIYDPNYPGETKYISWDPATGWSNFYDGYTYAYLDFSDELLHGDAGAEFREKFASWLAIAKACFILDIWPLFPQTLPVFTSSPNDVEEVEFTIDASINPGVAAYTFTFDNWEIPYILGDDKIIMAVPLHYGYNRLLGNATSLPVKNSAYGSGWHSYPDGGEVSISLNEADDYEPESFRLWLTWDNPKVDLDLWVNSPDGSTFWNYNTEHSENGGRMLMSDYKMLLNTVEYDSMQEMFVCIASPAQPFEAAVPGNYSFRVGYSSVTGTNTSTNYRVIATWGSGANTGSSVITGYFDNKGSAKQTEVGYASGGSGWSQLYHVNPLSEEAMPLILTD